MSQIQIDAGKDLGPGGVIACHVQKPDLNAVEIPTVIVKAHCQAALGSPNVVEGGNGDASERSILDASIATGNGESGEPTAADTRAGKDEAVNSIPGGDSHPSDPDAIEALSGSHTDGGQPNAAQGFSRPYAESSHQEATGASSRAGTQATNENSRGALTGPGACPSDEDASGTAARPGPQPAHHDSFRRPARPPRLPGPAHRPPLRARPRGGRYCAGPPPPPIRR